jgi:hypothetical protein
MNEYGPIMPETHHDKMVQDRAAYKPADIKTQAAAEELQSKSVQPPRDLPKDSSFISEEARKAFEARDAQRRREAEKLRERKESAGKKVDPDQRREKEKQGGYPRQAYERARELENSDDDEDGWSHGIGYLV